MQLNRLVWLNSVKLMLTILWHSLIINPASVFYSLVYKVCGWGGTAVDNTIRITFNISFKRHTNMNDSQISGLCYYSFCKILADYERNDYILLLSVCSLFSLCSLFPWLNFFHNCYHKYCAMRWILWSELCDSR